MCFKFLSWIQLCEYMIVNFLFFLEGFIWGGFVASEVLVLSLVLGLQMGLRMIGKLKWHLDVFCDYTV